MITVFIDRGLKEAATVLSGNSFNIIKHTMPELEDYKRQGSINTLHLCRTSS